MIGISLFIVSLKTQMRSWFWYCEFCVIFIQTSQNTEPTCENHNIVKPCILQVHTSHLCSSFHWNAEEVVILVTWVFVSFSPNFTTSQHPESVHENHHKNWSSCYTNRIREMFLKQFKSQTVRFVCVWFETRIKLWNLKQFLIQKYPNTIGHHKLSKIKLLWLMLKVDGTKGTSDFFVNSHLFWQVRNINTEHHVNT